MEQNLGKRLRAAREAAGLGIDDAVYRAKLPRAVVEALEAEDFGFFASPLYARSFLKQYGDYVGLDVSPWIDDLIPTPMIDGDSADLIIEIEEPPPPVLRERQRKGGGGGSLAALWLILITGGLVWGGMELFKEFESKHAKTPSPVPSTAAKPDVTVPSEATAPEDLASGQEKPDEEESVPTDQQEPPKRAIIVRDE
jgi:cytoskeleton protein RodZ